MSDMQCPAIIVLLTPETVVGRELAGHRLARVFIGASISIGAGAVVEANRLAALHGCRVEASIVADGSDLSQRIAGLADGYRGETVESPPRAVGLASAIPAHAAPYPIPRGRGR